ncbi:MAG: SRPBCC family protein [Nitriliruptoraceae bacterium]
MAELRESHREPPAFRPSDDLEHAALVSDGDGGRTLATAISINAVFSAVSGLVLLAGAPGLSGLFGVDIWLLVGIGGGLIGFAGVLIWLLAEPGKLAAGAKWVLAADITWIAGAIVLLAGLPTVLSTTGRLALVAVTVVVAAIVVRQITGMRRHGPGPMLATSAITLRIQRTIAAPTDRVWQLVADAGDYARFAPGIASTRIVAGQGEGMVRVCRDDKGGEWSETCTLWDSGHRYRMSVDVDSYPAHYQMLLAELTQTWTLEPAGHSTHIRLEFDGRVKLGIIGRLAAKLLGNRRRLEAILDTYERELTVPVQGN